VKIYKYRIKNTWGFQDVPFSNLCDMFNIMGQSRKNYLLPKLVTHSRQGLSACDAMPRAPEIPPPLWRHISWRSPPAPAFSSELHGAVRIIILLYCSFQYYLYLYKFVLQIYLIIRQLVYLISSISLFLAKIIAHLIILSNSLFRIRLPQYPQYRYQWMRYNNSEVVYHRCVLE